MEGLPYSTRSHILQKQAFMIVSITSFRIPFGHTNFVVGRIPFSHRTEPTRAFSADTRTRCNMSRIVLIDMDNTLVNFDAEFARRWASRRPANDASVVHNRKHFELELNFDERSRSDAVEVMSQAGFFIAFEPMPGAIEAVQAMVNEGLSVFFCTAPLPMQYETCVAEKYAWVRKHFGDEYLSKIIITRDKTVVKGAVLIDDKPLIKGACNEPEWKHIVFTQSYNKEVVTNLRLNSWDNWRQVVMPLV